MRRSFGALGLALALGFTATQARQAQVQELPLPATLTFPEGIAYDAKENVLYTGSAENGSVIRMPATADGSKQATTIVPEKGLLPTEPFPALLGMELDSGGRLWITGGRTGHIAVIDAKTGKTIKRFETPAQPAGLINDVTIAGGSAYFTDTFRPTLWRVPVKGGTVGDLESWLELSPAIEYSQGANLNGIASTPDGKFLIVVQMNKGLLFRIGVADKQIRPIDIGGEVLTTADGLVLDGRRLYVVRQGEQEIVTIDLSEDLSKGKVVSRFKDPALRWPATAAKAGDRLLVVNTQFNKRTTKDAVTPFSILSVPLSALGGK